MCARVYLALKYIIYSLLSSCHNELSLSSLEQKFISIVSQHQRLCLQRSAWIEFLQESVHCHTSLHVRHKETCLPSSSSLLVSFCFLCIILRFPDPAYFIFVWLEPQKSQKSWIQDLVYNNREKNPSWILVASASIYTIKKNSNLQDFHGKAVFDVMPAILLLDLIPITFKYVKRHGINRRKENRMKTCLFHDQIILLNS